MASQEELCSMELLNLFFRLFLAFFFLAFLNFFFLFYSIIYSFLVSFYSRMPYPVSVFICSFYFGISVYSHRSLSFFFLSFFFFWHYISQIVLHSSRSRDSRLQVLTPTFFRSSSTDSSHLNFGFPTRRVPSGLGRVSFLQGSSSCILNSCPSHLNFPLSTTFNYIWSDHEALFYFF